LSSPRVEKERKILANTGLIKERWLESIGSVKEREELFFSNPNPGGA